MIVVYIISRRNALFFSFRETANFKEAEAAGRIRSYFRPPVRLTRRFPLIYLHRDILKYRSHTVSLHPELRALSGYLRPPPGRRRHSPPACFPHRFRSSGYPRSARLPCFRLNSGRQNCSPETRPYFRPASVHSPGRRCQLRFRMYFLHRRCWLRRRSGCRQHCCWDYGVSQCCPWKREAQAL